MEEGGHTLGPQPRPLLPPASLLVLREKGGFGLQPRTDGRYWQRLLKLQRYNVHQQGDRSRPAPAQADSEGRGEGQNQSYSIFGLWVPLPT